MRCKRSGAAHEKLLRCRLKNAIFPLGYLRLNTALGSLRRFFVVYKQEKQVGKKTRSDSKRVECFQMTKTSIYSEEIINTICKEMASGKSLNAICKRDDMPCIATVMNWLVKAEMGDERFCGLLEKYLRAREAQADVIFDECLEIADDNLGDFHLDKDGKLVVDGDHIQRAKLRVDTRMRMAGKLKPKKYGDKQQFDIELRDKATQEQRDAAVAAALSADG